jgi:hypothetical protein
MQPTSKVIVAVFAGIAGIASGLHTASAQEMTAPGGYQFFVTPYLWLASVHATTMTPLAREPEVNSNVSTIDLLSHLDGAPFMGSGEVRYGQLGFFVDAIHLPVSTKITTHDIFFRAAMPSCTRIRAPGSPSTAFSMTRCNSPMPASDFALGDFRRGWRSTLVCFPV